MEKFTLVLYLAVGMAVGITAVPIPDSEVVSAPAGPVIVLTPDAPPLTNAEESYVIIEENRGNESEAEIYTVYSPLTAEFSISDHSAKPIPHVDSTPSEESEPASSSAAPAPEEPITEEPFAVEPAPIIIPFPKPELVSLQEGTSSSPYGGIISFLNPYHWSIPSLPHVSLPNFIPTKWPWSSIRLGNASSSNYIALRTPYHIYYAN